MSCIKCVTVALTALRKAAHAAFFTQIFEPFFSSGQNLVCICLMSYIPYDLVFRKFQNIVKCHRQFHNAKIGCQVASSVTYGFYQKLSDLLCKLWKVRQRNFVYIIWLIDLFQHPSYPSFISCALPSL